MVYKVTVDADLRDIVPGYLENRKAELPALSGLLAGGDFKGLRQAGHKLVGSGGGYGFDRISELGRQMETAAGACDGEKLGALIAELSDYLLNLEVSYFP